MLPFGRYLGNTLFITVGNILGNLISCTLAAYGFARLRGPGKNILFLLMLSTMMLPLWVTLIPQYILFSAIGWSNSFAPLMVPAWFGWTFFIFLLRQFFWFYRFVLVGFLSTVITVFDDEIGENHLFKHQV